jgi:hypothetical protein
MVLETGRLSDGVSIFGKIKIVTVESNISIYLGTYNSFVKIGLTELSYTRTCSLGLQPCCCCFPAWSYDKSEIWMENTDIMLNSARNTSKDSLDKHDEGGYSIALQLQ